VIIAILSFIKLYHHCLFTFISRYAELVGCAIKLVFHTLIENSDMEVEESFFKVVLSTFNFNNQATLALNVLDGIAEFYSIVSKDGSRTGVTARKLILQAVAGSKVRESGQISLVSDTLGARKKSLDREVEKRKELEEQLKLLPFVEMLRRNSPNGSRFITENTKMEVITFNENDDISDILKGHNNILKEIIVSETGVKTYFQRSKRVLKIHFCEMLKAAQKHIPA
jgi:hypothetical protein